MFALHFVLSVFDERTNDACVVVRDLHRHLGFACDRDLDAVVEFGHVSRQFVEVVTHLFVCGVPSADHRSGFDPLFHVGNVRLKRGHDLWVGRRRRGGVAGFGEFDLAGDLAVVRCQELDELSLFFRDRPAHG